MSYFAATLARSPAGWSAREMDLDEVPDLEALAEELRERSGDGDGPALLLVEEDDEYLAIVRVDGGPGSLDEPRVFLSDGRAVQASDVAAKLWETPATDADDEDDQDVRQVNEPVGDPALLTDLGTGAGELLELCAEEGLLPSDVLSAVCERAGCLDALEQVREA